MIVGIQQDQVAKWSAGFQNLILSSNEMLDKSLLHIKEEICYEKRVDHKFDKNYASQNDSITNGIQDKIENILSSNAKAKMSVKKIDKDLKRQKYAQQTKQREFGTAVFQVHEPEEDEKESETASQQKSKQPYSAQDK